MMVVRQGSGRTASAMQPLDWKMIQELAVALGSR
jgi:hypothetical protein